MIHCKHISVNVLKFELIDFHIFLSCWIDLYALFLLIFCNTIKRVLVRSSMFVCLKKVLYSACLIVLFCLLFTSCAPLIICGGAGIASVSMRNREGVSGSVLDNWIKLQINNKFQSKKLSGKVEIVVKHARVLLVGFVDDSSQAAECVAIAKDISKVVEVIDAIKIGHTQSTDTAAKDSWITSRVKSAMAVDGNIHCLNFNITTYNGIVYILGTAETQLELNAVVNIARSTSCVKKVVSYIELIEYNPRGSAN